MGVSLAPWRRKPTTELARSDGAISIQDWAEMFNAFSYQGVQYSMPTESQEEIAGNFASLARGAYKANGVVFACMLVRMLLFSEARFQFRRMVQGRPGDLFGNGDLAGLEAPWPGATTGDMLSRAIQYADLAGNAFFTNRYGGIRPLRPDWTTLVVGSDDPDLGALSPGADVVGYMFQPGGKGSGRDPISFLPDEVAHFCPIPDPEFRFRGMSWLTPIVREVMADKAATEHKLKFFEHGATPQMVIKLDVPDLEKMKSWIELFKQEHEGASNAYKTLYLGAGADATVVGADMKQLDFKVTQGAGETRVATAAGVPPVLVGLSEGLASATYSNYLHARRRFADMTMRPLWRNMAGSLAKIVTVPPGAELWYDDRDIPALQEDQKDAAEIQAINASAISSLITSGYKPDSVVAAVTANDLSRLVHTGLFSVQLQPPGTTQAPANGAGPVPAAAGANGDRLDEHVLELIRWNEARLEQSPPVVNVTVEPAPAPVSYVTVEAPRRPTRKEIDFGDGRTATITERGNTRDIDFGDGRVATVTEHDEEE